MFEPVRIIVGVQRHPEVPEEIRIPDDNLERLFRRIDSIDGCYDGKIDRARLEEMLAVLDRRRGSDDYKKAMREVRKHDVNRDGYLEREEFYRLMCHLRGVNTDPAGGSDTELQGFCRQPEPQPRSPPWLEKRMEETANAEPYRWCPPPWFILSTTLAQIGFFAFHVFHFLAKEEGSIRTTWHGPYQFCSVLIFNPMRRREFWRYVTYGFVHAGGQHLLTNVFLQLLVGLPLEMSNGSLRIATVYLTGALAGSLGVSAIKPESYLAGSSAAVFALVGGHCASVLLNWKEDRIVVRQRFHFAHLYTVVRPHSSFADGTVRLKQTSKTNKLRIVRLSFALLLAGVDITYSTTEKCYNGLKNCTTLEAHLCGLAAGVIVGIAVLKNRKQESWESTARVVAVVLLLSCFALLVCWSLIGDHVWRAFSGREEDWFMPEKMTERTNCSYVVNGRSIRGR